MPTSEDRDWFGAQVQAALPQLYGSALRLASNPADAEDLVADAIAKAWSSLDSLTDRTRVHAWLYRILTNTFFSGRRAAAAKVVHESFDDAGADFSLFERLHQPFLLWWGNPEQDFLKRLLRADLTRALENLPEPFRVAVVLADVQGFSYQEIADQLDVPIGTVRSRIARARALLQKALWEHACDAGITGARTNTETVQP